MGKQAFIPHHNLKWTFKHGPQIHLHSLVHFPKWLQLPSLFTVSLWITALPLNLKVNRHRREFFTFLFSQTTLTRIPFSCQEQRWLSCCETPGQTFVSASQWAVDPVNCSLLQETFFGDNDSVFLAFSISISHLSSTLTSLSSSDLSLCIFPC